MSEENKLRIIDGGGNDIIRPKRKSLEESQQIVCHKCNGSATIDITLCPRRKPNGKATGGTKIKACAICYANDKTIVELVKA